MTETNSNPFQRESIATADFVGLWYEIGPPNGCLPKHTERRVQRIEVYSADYYGQGTKLYVRGYSRIERQDYANSDSFGLDWEDGDPGRCAEWLQKVEAQNQ
jgi:hypothetical protein